MQRCLIQLLGLLCTAAYFAGCAPKGDLLETQLQSQDPAQRIRAIVQASHTARSDLLPALVDCLEDEDPAVRLYAIVALEKLTGTRLGYSYFSPPDQRREAVQAWRAHLSQTAAESPQRRADAGSQRPAGEP